jgi:hypothetical protein
MHTEVKAAGSNRASLKADWSTSDCAGLQRRAKYVFKQHVEQKTVAFEW